MATPNPPDRQLSGGQGEPDLTFDDIIPAIQKSKKWKILVYGVSDKKYTQEQNDHHVALMGGILGEQVTPNKLTPLPSYQCKKNGVTVIFHIGSHADCTVTAADVDLLLFFLPVDEDNLHESCSEQITKITMDKGALIWKHSIAVLTGVDTTVDRHSQMGGKVSVRLESLFECWTGQLQRNLASAIGDKEGVSKTDVLIRLAGKQEKPDLPKPHEKWFSQFWLGCFTSSKVSAMPAAMKLAQGRIANSIANKEICVLDFYQQSIQVKENSVDLPQSLRVGLGIGGSAAIAGAAAAGATTGALIGALAIGIPSFGVAAGTGLVLGAVIGGGVGAGVAGAVVGGGYKVAKDKQQEQIQASELKLYYAEILSRLPKVCASLQQWAKKQVTLKVVVTGVMGEGVSTAAAAIVGEEPREGGSGLYWKQVVPMQASLCIYDDPVTKAAEAKELFDFMKSKHINLHILCIPMTSSREQLVYSPHIKYLERLCEIDDSILSNTVIALTHANEMPAELMERDDSSQANLQRLFNNEVEKWKEQIGTELPKCLRIEEGVARKIPVVPIGNSKPTIDLSRSEYVAAHYPWLSELLLHAMPATKPEGLPTLVKTNKKRLENHPDQYRDPDRAHDLIVEAQCSMFSQIGLRDMKNPGEAIGHILGVKEVQDW